MFWNFSGWANTRVRDGRDAIRYGRDDDDARCEWKEGSKWKGPDRDHDKTGHRKGHEKDRDDTFDHGHDQHGKGHGYGHDKHCPPPAGPACTDVDENESFVFDLDSAPRLNGGTGDAGVVYSIVGGADAALFRIDGETGQLAFITAPDFETPLDADGDNSYAVTVRAIDVQDPCKFVDEKFKVCVRDVDETSQPGPNAAPQIIAPENTLIFLNVGSRGEVVADIDAIDPDNGPQPITYAISGEDSDFFLFDTETGEITARPDVQLFEAVQEDGNTIFVPVARSFDGDFTFEVTVTASDGLDFDAIDLQLTLFLAA